MIRKKRSPEEINKKCEMLQRLGFEIEHEDSRVSFDGHNFDFSATACDEASILQTALKAMFKHGVSHGKNEVISGVRKMFNIDTDPD